MKSATETIAKVQSGRVRCMARKCSLTSLLRQGRGERLRAKLVMTYYWSAQGTSTESSVGESRATMYSAGSVSETFWTVWVSRGGT